LISVSRRLVSDHGSAMREIPHSPVALYEVAHLFGTLIAKTILASVHVRARKQAGHMGASDLIKALQNTLRGEGSSHMANPGGYYPSVNSDTKRHRGRHR
jgi:hypothetical protein